MSTNVVHLNIDMSYDDYNHLIVQAIAQTIILPNGMTGHHGIDDLHAYSGLSPPNYISELMWPMVLHPHVSQISVSSSALLTPALQIVHFRPSDGSNTCLIILPFSLP